jgi:hypothetical protein
MSGVEIKVQYTGTENGQTQGPKIYSRRNKAKKKKDTVFGVMVPPISVLLQEISMPGQETNPVCRLKQFPVNP